MIPFSPFPSGRIHARLHSNVFLKKSQLGIPLNSLILMDLQSHSPSHYPALSGYKQRCSVHLWAIFPAWSDCRIVSCFSSRSWCKNKMAESFVGCKEGTKCKAQMDAVPREEGSVCGGSVVLPVGSPSLGCMESGWIFLRGPWVRT